MDIECQGCYYTVCSFVCLTEDLSEILQFLWRHGCLRKSYLCEKCGRKCAIGDKDLFFRCNRNLVDPSPDSDLLFQQSLPRGPVPPPPQLQSNGSSLQLDLHEMQHQYSVHLGDERLSLQESSGLLHRPNMMVHPVLRHTASLPGDPLPPTQPSPVFQAIDRHFMLGHDSMVHCGERHAPVVMHVADISTEREGKVLTVMERNPANVRSVRVDELESLPDSELADLDAHSKIHKQSKNGSSSTSLGLKKRCNFKVSMKKGTFFEKSKLPIDTVCKFVMFWCCMKHPTQEFLRNELSLATRTVVDWSTTCREICIHWAKSNSEKIGGDGVIVQVDEVKIVVPKMGDSSDKTGSRFSFWGIEKDKDKGKIFVVPVPACDSWSLLNVLNDWILPGSVVISNCWKAYDCLKLQEYVQQTLVQSKTFVHPPSNAGQANFEDQCVDPNNRRKAEDMQMPRFGTRRSHHLGDLAEFMFKRRYSNHLERMHAFFKQVAMAYPLR